MTTLSILCKSAPIFWGLGLSVGLWVMACTCSGAFRGLLHRCFMQLQKKVVTAAVLCLGCAGSAMAELPTEAQAAVDKVTADITSYGTWARGAATAVTGILIGIKLFRKFSNRAT